MTRRRPSSDPTAYIVGALALAGGLLAATSASAAPARSGGGSSSTPPRSMPRVATRPANTMVLKPTPGSKLSTGGAAPPEGFIETYPSTNSILAATQSTMSSHMAQGKAVGGAMLSLVTGGGSILG